MSGEQSNFGPSSMVEGGGLFLDSFGSGQLNTRSLISGLLIITIVVLCVVLYLDSLAYKIPITIITLGLLAASILLDTSYARMRGW